MMWTQTKMMSLCLMDPNCGLLFDNPWFRRFMSVFLYVFGYKAKCLKMSLTNRFKHVLALLKDSNQLNHVCFLLKLHFQHWICWFIFSNPRNVFCFAGLYEGLSVRL